MVLRPTILAAAAACVAHAQAPSLSSNDLYVGARMRLDVPSSPNGRLVVPFSGIDSSRLTVTVGERGSTLSLPLGDVVAAERSIGRDVQHWGLAGGLIGIAAGALTYAAFIGQARRADAKTCPLFTLVCFRGNRALLAQSAALVPAAGAVVGLLIAPERWQRVALPTGSRAADSVAHVGLVEGDVIRARHGAERVRGMISQVSRDSLVLFQGGTRTTRALRDLQALEISGGSNRYLGAARGAAIGMIATFTMGAAGGAGKSGMIALTVLGGVLGSVFGWEFAPTNWNAVPSGARW